MKKIMKKMLGVFRKKPISQTLEPFSKYRMVGNAWREMRTELDAWLRQRKADGKVTLLDVGGGDGKNVREFLEDRGGLFDISILDIEEAVPQKTFVWDITVPLEGQPPNCYDVVYSYNAFEHFKEPGIAADNVCRLLAPGGLCLIHTIFSWRYHPVPEDYFRFTDDALNYLFSERNSLRLLKCGYDLKMRRMDIRGGYFGDRDVPPIDHMGGFRENWVVFYIGMKPESS